MAETLTELDWFHHFHQATMTELTVLVNEDVELPEEASENQTQKLLLNQHQGFLKSLLNNLKKEPKPDPASVFKKALGALSEIEKERFLRENQLEAIKRGESLSEIAERYNALKLSSLEVSNIPREAPPSAESTKEVPNPPASSMAAGNLLQRLLARLKKVSVKVMQLLVNAMKVIPKFVGIKPSVGFSGPFPSLSFQIDLEAQPLTLFELFQDLTAGFET
jgi:hypothetical protein